MSESIHQRIHRLRLKAGLSYQELRDRIVSITGKSLAWQAIQQWEGKGGGVATSPRPKSRAALAQVFAISETELMFGEGANVPTVAKKKATVTAISSEGRDEVLALAARLYRLKSNPALYRRVLIEIEAAEKALSEVEGNDA